LISRLKAVEKLKMVVNSHTLFFNKIALRAMCESLPIFSKLNDQKHQSFKVVTVIVITFTISAKKTMKHTEHRTNFGQTGLATGLRSGETQWRTESGDF
jgi:hypothetical protein